MNVTPLAPTGSQTIAGSQTIVCSGILSRFSAQSSQQHGPSLAQIKSEYSKGLQRSHSLQYAQVMAEEVQKRLGNDTSMVHTIQVLKQMTAEGKIDCPTPFINPGHYFFAPLGREFESILSEGPILLPNNSTKVNGYAHLLQVDH